MRTRAVHVSQVLELPGSLSEKKRYSERPRVCNLGYLRTPYMKADGTVGYRCASEPVNDWLKKGGELQAAAAPTLAPAHARARTRSHARPLTRSLARRRRRRGASAYATP